MELFVPVCWPEIQDLMHMHGFEQNAFLINDEKGMERFGSSAYFVSAEWLADMNCDDVGIDDWLWNACEQMADDMNEEQRVYDEESGEASKPNYVFLETNANGFYVNKEKRVVEFSFTVMNEKSWREVPFEDMEEYGISVEELENYKD